MSLKRKRGMEQIIDSRIVTFVIGKDDSAREFRVHEGALTCLSEPLRALLTGEMQESLEGKVILDDVEPATFLHLLDYAYTGSYPIQLLEIKENAKEDMNEEDSEEEYDSSESLRTWIKTLSSRKSNKRHAVSDFCKQHFSKNGNSAVTLAGKDLPPLQEDSEEGSDGTHSQILLALDHLMEPAKLYILADKYLIDDLKSLCVDDIRQKLYNGVVEDDLLTHVCSVLRFLHPHTLPRDKLRKLLLRYFIGVLGWKMKNEDVRELLSEFPDFAVELLFKIPDTYWEELV
ncbi:hypothetical protein CORC01_07383 [Colletotrichum orchidophilum]|uniref:BTB domain-containing protein n=1 Tax=Colletotrichum orchidophilum TaxID=1209926 RepID=A0A1G4B795_9PEZI|nr:uncharacterized protein CORC01_07383 [Colletotrichum orchidophilum]OHE97328.1 hypothetical protein CORC01_07383 [Colletotrichum orchidophilum]